MIAENKKNEKDFILFVLLDKERVYIKKGT